MLRPAGILRLGVTGMVTALVAGCGDVTGTGDVDGTARLRVLLTDAPSDMFEEVTVTVGAVTLIGADEVGAEGEVIEGTRTILTDAGGTFDLLKLRDGVTATLADLEIAAGRYEQIRMIVTDAEVTLAEGYEFAGGGRTQSLKVPSGAQSGLKINLSAADGADDMDGTGGDPQPEGVEITGETTLVIDFDVCQNFKFQGNPDTPAGLKGVLFTPVLRAVVLEGAGSISGTVRDGAGAGVQGLTVRASMQDPGMMEPDQTKDATAVTGEDGTYTIRFLAPGTYDVSIDGSSVDPQTVTVGEGEDVTGVDFTVS